MSWWIWGGVIWAAMTSVGVLYLAAVCVQRRRPRSAESMLDVELLPGFAEEAPGETPLPDASASEGQVPARRGPDSPSATPGGWTQPLELPPGAAADDTARESGPHRLLDRLVEGRSGSYTVPERLLEVHRAGRLLGDLRIPAPVHIGREEAAARLVTAAMDSRPLDPMGLCAEMHRSRTDRLLHQEALDLLSAATMRAQDAAVREAAEACDAIIVEHLRPAYHAVLRQAREVARKLDAYIDDRFQPDTRRIMTASRKVRNAYLSVPELVRRHSSILEARDLANRLGERIPQCDRRGLFSVFEKPLTFATAPGLPYADILVPPLPADATARLLWLVSQGAAAGQPWLPTVAQQDAAWEAHFGRTAQVPRLATSD